MVQLITTYVANTSTGPAPDGTDARVQEVVKLPCLAAMHEWVALCQRCAISERPKQFQPSVVPLKTRQ